MLHWIYKLQNQTDWSLVYVNKVFLYILSLLGKSHLKSRRSRKRLITRKHSARVKNLNDIVVYNQYNHLCQFYCNKILFTNSFWAVSFTSSRILKGSLANLGGWLFFFFLYQAFHVLFVALQEKEPIGPISLY